MTPDDLRQITDAVYYVAHTIKVVGGWLMLVIALTGLVLIVDTTHIINLLKQRK